MGVFAEALRQFYVGSSDVPAETLPHDESPAIADSVVEMSPQAPLAIEPYQAVNVDSLARVAVDRSYGRLWDSLTEAGLERPPWAIVVAGAGSQDAAWLLPMAVAFAQRYPGQVLLVDASAHRSGSGQGGLSEHLGLNCRFGVAHVLRATVDWRDAVEPTPVPRIGLLASGHFASIADSALKANAANLIAELKSSYQLVLIQAGDACDPLVAPLVAASDGTLLLLELGQTSRAVAEKASSSLYLSGARLLGCVVRG
jgi:Mrp family chromosome partitioning ATPase